MFSAWGNQGGIHVNWTHTKRRPVQEPSLADLHIKMDLVRSYIHAWFNLDTGRISQILSTDTLPKIIRIASPYDR